MVGNEADTSYVKERFGDKRAREKSGQGTTDNRNDWYECISKSMVADNNLFGKTLCSCGSDVVCIENFKSVGTGISHKAAYADYYQSYNGQQHMLAGIYKLAKSAELFISSALHTADVEPAELGGKDQFQK